MVWRHTSTCSRSASQEQHGPSQVECHKTHKGSTALCADLLCLILPKWVMKVDSSTDSNSLTPPCTKWISVRPKRHAQMHTASPKLTVKNSYAEFHKNRTDGLVSVIRWRIQGRRDVASTQGFCLLRKECLKLQSTRNSKRCLLSGRPHRRASQIKGQVSFGPNCSLQLVT